MQPHQDITAELVPLPDRTLFRTDDPVEVLKAASTVAEALKGALKAGGMVQKIGDNEHVRIDGWQTLGSMLGVAPYVVWSRPIEGGWEARAEARTADGRIVGAADAMCTHAERNWKTRDEYALRSMAQTRAMSKALRGPLGFIITLAGHSATPAEEIDSEAFGAPASQRDREDAKRAAALLYDGDVTAVDGLLDRLERDAGGYLPRITARAVQLVAARRPGPATKAPTTSEAGDSETVSIAESTPRPDSPDPQPMNP